MNFPPSGKTEHRNDSYQQVWIDHCALAIRKNPYLRFSRKTDHEVISRNKHGVTVVDGPESRGGIGEANDLIIDFEPMLRSILFPRAFCSTFWGDAKKWNINRASFANVKLPFSFPLSGPLQKKEECKTEIIAPDKEYLYTCNISETHFTISSKEELLHFSFPFFYPL